MPQTSYIEVVLRGEPLLEHDELQEIVNAALDQGYRLSELRTDPVVDRGQWVSTQESTTPTPLLYLERGKAPSLETAVILQGDEKFQMYQYRWMA